MAQEGAGRRWLIEVAPREGFGDGEGARVLGAIREFGIRSVAAVRASTLYEVAGPLGREDAERAAREIFSDSVAERFELIEAPFSGPARRPGDPGEKAARENPPPVLTLTVLRRPGVMDPVVASARKALRDAGFPAESIAVRTARRYRIEGALSPAERETVERRVIANAVVEEVIEGEAPPPPAPPQRPAIPARRAIPLDALERVNRDLGLALSPVEIEAIRARYARLGREPTEIELETIAQTWSEHCKHKTLAGAVRYRGPIPWSGGGTGTKIYANLLKETIFAATRALAREDFVLSAFEDNAGAIAFDEERAVCMKVETHNHPSALEPYGGAGTGVGGVIRDILGFGLAAKPIANTDVFCVGPPDLPADRVPKGALHPRQVLRGIVSGVRDYGNRMGIPTVSGALYVDERYVANPLVYCGTVGIIPRTRIAKAPRAGDRIVLAGGRTGRDGIHGATFSSLELHGASERTSSGAVQIGNAIEEKRLLDVLLQARDRGLFRAVTDCGAGGLSSAVGEMAARLGARVALDRVPLKYEGLEPAEVWISEAQERMVLAAPPERLEELLALFASEDVEATAIGEFTGDGRLRLFWGELEVGELDLDFLHEGLPRVERPAEWREAAPPASPEALARAARALERPRFDEDVLAILGSWNVCSKEAIVRQYDHEVQGTSVLKPFLGARDDGPGDAAVLAPVRGSRRGLAIACGANPRFSDLDPYRMAQAAVDEALRNAVAVGADPERAALLDNFCWGDTSLRDRLGSLVLAAEGAARAAAALGAPFISGKDSLNNEFRTERGERIAVPPTLLVSCIALHPDVARAVSADAKRGGDLLYLVGRTGLELGGSHLHLVRGATGGEVPAADLALARRIFRALHAAIAAGLVLACHDVAEGGIAVAAAEMAIGGRVGVEIDLAALAASPGAAAARPGGPTALLFSESLSRFLVEIAPEKAADFERALEGVPIACIGRTTERGALRIGPADGVPLCDVSLDALVRAYQEPLLRVFS